MCARPIARLFKEKSPDDLLLLYFSGHGVLDDQGHLYLAVKDTERDLLSGTAIPANFITGEMDRSRSKRQVLDPRLLSQRRLRARQQGRGRRERGHGLGL